MSRPLVLQPVEQVSAPLRRKVTTSLRQAIESQALPAGSRLVEKTLCEELNVSRSVLREALRELESDGLVTNGPKGLVVASISGEEAFNIYAVRGALEALVCEQFTKLADAQAIASLEDAAEILAGAYINGDVDGIVAAKGEFYEVLCNGAHNLIAHDMLTRLNSRIRRLRFTSLSRPNRMSASFAEIEELVVALKKRNARAAKRIAELHVRNAARVALESGKEDNHD